MNEEFISNADDPITTLEEDMLKRGPFVDRLAAILKAAPSHSSSVFGLYGEWGTGKTSVKNLVIKRLEEKKDDQAAPLIVEFNPWAFSGQSELFQSFFSEVSRSLGRKDAGDVAVALNSLGGYLSMGSKVARSLQTVADIALLPGGSLLGVLAQTLDAGGTNAKEYAEELKQGKITSLEEIQEQLRTALDQLPRSILIILDDIDRLPPEQVLQIFQVIRINASLPKINFLLLLDYNSIVQTLVMT